MPEEYFLNTRKLYKTWFTNDPEIFLNFENQLRFIKFRKYNPEADISLVYSSELLSEKAKQKMNVFCATHNIMAVNFDTEIFGNSIDPQEIAIHQLAKQELQAWAPIDIGGNGAAASDILRFSKKVIEKCGVYSDFDVIVKLDELPKKYKIKSPIILPTRCNDFIAFAKDQDDNIHIHAYDLIDKGQLAIISNYKAIKDSTNSQELLSFIPDLSQHFDFTSNADDIKYFYDLYSKQNSTEKSLPNFRYFINSLSTQDILKQKYTEIIALNRVKEPYLIQLQDNAMNDFSTLTDEQSKLLLANLLYPDADDSINKTTKYISNFKRSMYLALVTEFSGPTITHKLLEGSYDHLISNNNLSEYIQTQGDLIRDRNDLSWHSTGAAKIKNKEEKLLKAVKQLKSNFKRKKLTSSSSRTHNIPRGL